MELQEVSTPARTEQINVLLVDDDLPLLEGVADLLELNGYSVMTATNGQEALAVMRERAPDLIISDIAMPEMDGYEFFRAVRSNPAWTPIPFIFLTARGSPTDVQRGNSMGVDAYLVKPFAPQDLLAAVHGRLQRVREISTVTRAEVERMKHQMLMMLGHELRTPLTYIYGYVSLLQDQHKELDDATIDNMLDGIRRGADRLVRLVEDLMLLIRIDSGVVGTEIMLRRVPANLMEMIDGIVSRAASFAAERGVTVTVDVPEGLLVNCMDLYLQDALARVIDNAIKFSRRQSGQVTITARVQGNEVLIAIRDNGIGIDPSQHEAIFERFIQIDRDTMEQQGVGLGLAIAREIVRLHGGEIEVESRPGAGSVFTIRLPWNGF